MADKRKFPESQTFVLQQDRSALSQRMQEPTGAAESLHGKIDPKQMGDRASYAKPTEKIEKMKQKINPEELSVKKVKQRKGYASVVDAMEGLEAGLKYRPRTRETKETYSIILHFFRMIFGDISELELKAAVDEILIVVKDEQLKDFDKKKKVEEILQEPMDNDSYSRLINLSKKLTDYFMDQEEAELQQQQQDGVAVVFDEEEEEEDDYVIRDDETDEEEEEADEEEEIKKQPKLEEEETDDDVVYTSQKKKSESDLPASQIDAFWLQRLVGKYYPDTVESQQLSQKILEILGQSATTRDCENALVQLLNYSNFDLVKILVQHQQKIYWCTQWSNTADKDLLEEEMKKNGLWDLLSEINGKPAAMDVDEKEKPTIPLSHKLRDRAPKPELLDLESLAFSQGAHFMSNKKCKLPENSYKTVKVGYEEITIPAPKPTPLGPNETLVSIRSMPEWTHPAFPSAKSLNRVQSRVYPCAFESDENLLLCAPTGAGKTNVAMLTILREIGKYRDSISGKIDLNRFKIVYVAPMKALVQEMVGNFKQRLSPYGIRVEELSGDKQLSKHQINETQIIVTTPEKWDIITRKSNDRSYTKLVRLMIIDEIHLLHDERGPVLESLVARIIRQVEQDQNWIRLVGLSATLPNYQDVGTFLRVDPKIGLFYFENGFRPCPLKQIYVGVSEKKVLKRVRIMNEVTYEKCLEQASGGQQVLVFVNGRKETYKTARMIRDLAIEREMIGRFIKQDSGSREVLAKEAEQCQNRELRELLEYGFAIHHAGLSRNDRQLVEDLFANGHVSVLCSTATLAWYSHTTTNS